MQDPNTTTNGDTPAVTTTDALSTTSADTMTTSSVEATSSTTASPADATTATPAPSTASTLPVAEEVAGVPTSTEVVVATAEKYRRQVITQYAIAFGIIVVILGALGYVMEKQGRIHTGLLDKVDSLVALVVPEKAAATVNGTRLSMSQYDNTVNQLVASYHIDPTDATATEQVKKMALDQLINTELLRQAAVAAGITVTDADVDERYQAIVKQLGSAEELATRMQQLGITTDSLRHDIHDELLIQRNLSTAISTTTQTVTDAEVKAAYDEQVKAAPKGQKIPTYTEVKEGFRAQLLESKQAAEQQGLIQKYIDSLKEKADIKMLI